MRRWANSDKMIAGRAMIPVIKMTGFIHNHWDLECTIIFLCQNTNLTNWKTVMRFCVSPPLLRESQQRHWVLIKIKRNLSFRTQMMSAVILCVIYQIRIFKAPLQTCSKVHKITLLGLIFYLTWFPQIKKFQKPRKVPWSTSTHSSSLRNSWSTNHGPCGPPTTAVCARLTAGGSMRIKVNIRLTDIYIGEQTRERFSHNVCLHFGQSQTDQQNWKLADASKSLVWGQNSMPLYSCFALKRQCQVFFCVNWQVT